MSHIWNISYDKALLIGVSSVVGAGVALNAFRFAKKFYENVPPKKWRKVGELTELWCFPVKSCGPIAVNEIECGLIGPNAGYMRDRVFMLTCLNGELVSARTYPQMVRIFPKIDGNILTMSASKMPDLIIDIDNLYTSKSEIQVTIWKDSATCIDCGDKAAAWFSKFILGKESGFRFVFYPSNDPKPNINDKKYLFGQADDMDTGALHDETSFMLMNQGSFDDLNTRLEKPVTALQYRPNFLVKGPKAWEEDNWKWIKIGEQTIFKNVQPCTRCILTNINPSTGERTPQMEPLRTLKTFRVFKDTIGTSPFFGIHLGIRKLGKVEVGDSVYVNE